MKIQNLSILGGCGHIGLPLGILCAQEGIMTTLVDSDEAVVEKVARGEPPFRENGTALPLKSALDSGRLRVTASWEALSESEVVVVTTVGTVPTDDENVDASFVFSLMEQLCEILRQGQVVLLRSTLAPGVSERIFHFLKERGATFSLGYCPERILQGEALDELRNLPQIISGFDEKAIRTARDLFSCITRASIVELPVREAELAKIFCNAWRYINFAISNQFWEIAQGAGCDFSRIRDAVRKDYPRMSEFSSAGFVGGSCLKKDVLQLATLMKDRPFLGNAALEVNDGMVSFIGARLSSHFGGCEGITVGVLGLTFKKDSDDLRNSLSLQLVSHLTDLGAIVSSYDPYVPSDSLEKVLDGQAVVVATPHSAFRDLTYKDGTLVINPWE